MIYQYFTAFLLATIAITHANCQQAPIDTTTTLKLTLSEVWEKVELFNKTIQIKKLRIDGSIEEIKDAKQERLPEIEAEGEYAKVTNMPLYENGIFSSPTQFEVLHTTYSLGANAYLNIYNGNKTNIKIAERESEKDLMTEQKNLSVSEMKLRAAAYYLDMQRSAQFKDLLLKDIAFQEKQLLHIKQLQQNGVVLKSDVLRAELKLSKQKLSLVTLDNDLLIANQKLNILIGLEDSLPINPIENINIDSLQIKTYEDYLADAYNNSYQIKISKKETELRELQVKDVKANVSPKVGLFAQYAYSYPQIFLYPYSPYLYGIGFGGVKASFPISSFYHNKHKALAAEIALKSQEVEHADTEDLIREEVKAAYLKFKESIKRIDVAKTNIAQATENARIVNNTYFNQLSLLTDLLDADTQLLQTKFDFAAAQIAAQLQYYQLQKAIGKL